MRDQGSRRELLLATFRRYCDLWPRWGLGFRIDGRRGGKMGKRGDAEEREGVYPLLLALLLLPLYLILDAGFTLYIYLGNISYKQQKRGTLPLLWLPSTAATKAVATTVVRVSGDREERWVGGSSSTRLQRISKFVPRIPDVPSQGRGPGWARLGRGSAEGCCWKAFSERDQIRWKRPPPPPFFCRPFSIYPHHPPSSYFYLT